MPPRKAMGSRCSVAAKVLGRLRTATTGMKRSRCLAARAYVCVPGTLVHIPRRTVHGFQYRKGGGQMLEITGENARAALMFDALDRTSMDGPPVSGLYCNCANNTESSLMDPRRTWKPLAELRRLPNSTP